MIRTVLNRYDPDKRYRQRIKNIIHHFWALPGMGMLNVNLYGMKMIPKVKGMDANKGLISYEDAMNEAIAAYENSLSEDKLKQLKKDILKAWFRNWVTPHEYYIFGFKSLSDKERRSFVSRFEKDMKMISNIGIGDNYQLLHNKYRFYERFQKYFKRDVLKFSEKNLTEFESFCSKHLNYIAKSESGRMGVGILVRRHNGTLEEIQKEEEFLLNHGKIWIVEEYIMQEKTMKMLYPASVNSIRICSRWDGKQAIIFEAALRMGRNGKQVDNLSNGGIAALIDYKTGIVKTDGIDNVGNTYIYHPDTNIAIKGFEIPKWSDLYDLLNQLHQEIPYYPYVGWDFALTENGWDLIEGNWGNYITQYFKQGVRKEFQKIF